MDSSSSTTSADEPFVPAPGLTNGHVMTIAAWARPRTFPSLPRPNVRLFAVDHHSQVRADCYWQPDRADRPTVLGFHGLEGSSEAHYLRGIADKAWRRRWNVVLLNQRNCGGTEHLTPGLYHSGLTADPWSVLRQLHEECPLTAIGVIGYSLGGNLALKLAGEAADAPDLPLRAVAVVSPALDLARCVDAIEQPANLLYQWHFVRGLKARMRRKCGLFPGTFDLEPLSTIRTVREFDDAYTAPQHGFGTAANYYAQATALRVIGRIAVPTLIIAAEDDPFVPADQFSTQAVSSNPNITISIQRHGGHCGFIGRRGANSDGYWAEQTAVRFLSAHVCRS